MDKRTQHRKARLQALIESPRFDGSQVALANAVGRTEGYISQLLDPNAPFGTRAADGLAAHRGGFLLRKWRVLQFVAGIFRNIFRFLCIYL